MEYSYIAYNKNQQIVKGRVPASSENDAQRLLSYGGYRVLSLKPYTPFFNLGNINLGLGRVKPGEITLFSRQLALLLESGIDIVTAFELLQEQSANRNFKKLLGSVANDIRGGSALSVALSKHPKVFSQVYYRAIAAGEESGNLENVLRNMANFMERTIKTEKKIKSALTYPIIVMVVAVAVISLMVVYVFPTFTSLYSSLGTQLPVATRALITLTEVLVDYGLYILIGLVVAVVALVSYIRTPAGRYWWSKVTLRMPVIGRIIQLSELSRACQTIALLFNAGLPLPEIMTQAVDSAGNRKVAESLSEVHHELMRGEGLSKPMAKRPVFLPLMVQMVSVGEETGKLDDTLRTVVTTYDVETDDRIDNAVNLIQPIMTITIGAIIAFIAVALVSAMYSLYGQLD